MRYLPPPDVAGVQRCYFEFRSQEVSQWIDRYRGCRRYRFNKFLPISERFPEPTTGGLKFTVAEMETLGLIGIKTTVGLPTNGEVIFRFSSSELQELQDVGGFAEIGVGFIQYESDWWWPVDGLGFSCRRQLGATNQVLYTGLNSMPLSGSSHLAGVGSAFTIAAKHRGDALELHFIEYAADGITPVVESVREQTGTHILPDTTFQVMLYMRGIGARASCILARTDFKWEPSVLTENTLNLDTSEKIYFYQNPAEYTLPIGAVQAPPVALYSQPHVAYIEDGTIELSSPSAPMGWVNLLFFLVDSTVEPMIFSDIEGKQWLTCFSEATGKGRKQQGTIASGYTLQLPVLVVH